MIGSRRQFHGLSIAPRAQALRSTNTAFNPPKANEFDIAAALTGAVVKDPVQDRVVWLEYLKTIVKEREGWKDLYRACMDVLE